MQIIFTLKFSVNWVNMQWSTQIVSTIDPCKVVQVYSNFRRGSGSIIIGVGLGKLGNSYPAYGSIGCLGTRPIYRVCCQCTPDIPRDTLAMLNVIG